jgi:hypothetical protein
VGNVAGMREMRNAYKNVFRSEIPTLERRHV